MSQKLRINVHVNPSEVLEAGQTISLNVQDDTSWSDVCELIKQKANNLFTESLAFQYLDDDADYISGCTESEWKDAIASGTTKSRDQLILHIKAVPTDNVAKQLTQCDLANEKPVCCYSDPWCCYERPMPDNPIFYENVPEKIVNPQSSSYKYADEALRAVTLPLGPIGGGSIALAGDGGLRQWQVVNEVCHLAHVPDSFFAIKVETGESTSTSVVLQSNTWYNQQGFIPAPIVKDHVVPQGSIDLLKVLPGVKTLEVTARYPIAEVDVLSDEVPVQVHLEAFNPCIPLNSDDSALPMIIFNYTVTNHSDKKVKVTMLSSLLNFIGWDGKSIITSDNMPNTPGGNQNTLYTCGGNIDGADVPEYKGLSGYHGIYMNNTKLDDRCSSNGELSIGVLTKDGDVNSYLLQYTDVEKMWQEFSTATGLSGQGEMGVSDNLKTWVGAISCRRVIQAGKSETFTFVLSWHFPYRYCPRGEWGPATDSKSLFYLGNYYNNLQENVKEVVSYTVQNIGRLTKYTRAFRDAMFGSTLPWQLIDSAAGRVSVPRSPTFMWLEDSNLYCFEGCNPEAGCCPMNCTHVLNYEMVVAKCFPDLERKMRNIDLLINMAPNAIIPSRTTMPLSEKREWESWNWCSTDPIKLSSTNICLDGDLGTVLKTYREIRQGAPQSFVDKVWPKIKAMLKRYMDDLDSDKKGLITGAQPCTYDRATYGIDTFIGCLYLCALRAAEEMAKLMSEDDVAEKYHQRFLIGSKNLDALCFQNGRWYTQVTPQWHPDDEFLGCGTFIDALIGQWWAHSLGLGYLLPKDHIQSHLSWVFKRNHVTSFDSKVKQSPRAYFDRRDAGLYITYWDVAAGEKIPKVPLRYSQEGAWSGLEHSFAGLLLYEKLMSTAYQVAEECRNKYDGTRRSPWNEIECGDHYARPMAAFLYFEIASGMTWNILAIGEQALKLNFAPICNADNFKSFFIVASGWGSYSQTVSEDAGSVELSVVFGEVDLVTLGLEMSFTIAKASLDGKEIKTTLTKENGKIILSFPEAPVKSFAAFEENILKVGASQSLQISLS